VSSPAVQPILALLAHPVGGHSIQFVVEKAFAQLNLDWRFLSLEVTPEGLADAVRGMRAMGFRGGAIADPHRRAVLPLLDGLTDAATLLGSVNLVVGEENHLRGDNTEGRGLIESLRRVIDPVGKRCLILDAGELAQAVAVELASTGVAEIRIADPSAERTATTAGLFAGKLPAVVTSLNWDSCFRVPEDIDVLIHALSLAPHDAETHLPVDAASLRPELIVADLAVNPDEAWLLREAGERGCKTIDGLSTMVEQMAVDFRIWTSLDPDRLLMREAVEEFLGL